jgi:predicted outer membrane repeat protein
VTFANNTATSNGGAIYNYLSTLSITNSTFTGNSAGGGGGAIKNDNGTLTVSNSTFSGNSASVGGAIIALGASITTVRNSTFSGNSAGTAAGIYSNGTLNYANTIIANSTGNDCTSDGTLGINLNNLVEDGSCSASLSGDPKLGALANNGGSTQTFALLAGSAAINAGNDTVCLLAPVNDLDQRGTIRPNGPQCDIGAYEYVDITAPTVSSFTPTTHSNSLSIPITAFTATDALDVTGYMITQSSTPPSAGAAGWSASAPTTYIVASEGSYTLYPWAKDAAGNVSSVSGSPATVSVDTTVPTVTSFTATTPATSLAIPITAFTATDAIGVAGYIITQSPTPPSAGAAGWSTSAPTSYSVGNDGTYTLYPWAKDAAGNVSSVFASPASVSVDTSAPTVVSSVRSNHNPTTAASVEFLVTFSEAVTGVDAADLNLTMTGSVSGALISSVSGAGRTYTVTVSTGSGAGTLRLDVTDNDSIADTASNRLGGTGAGNGAFTNGEAYTKEQYRIYLALVRR